VGFSLTKPDFLEVFEETMAAGWGELNRFLREFPSTPSTPPKGRLDKRLNNKGNHSTGKNMVFPDPKPS
jgi:hypothetical protein